MVTLLFCDWPIAQVLDDDRECALGVLEFPLCRLLPCADLTLEQRFQLDHSGLDSLISMRLVLRVNCSPGPPEEARGGALAWSKVHAPALRPWSKPGRCQEMDSYFLSILEYCQPLSLQILPLPVFRSFLLLCWTLSSSPPCLNLTSSSYFPSL